MERGNGTSMRLTASTSQASPAYRAIEAAFDLLHVLAADYVETHGTLRAIGDPASFNVNRTRAVSAISGMTLARAVFPDEPSLHRVLSGLASHYNRCTLFEEDFLALSQRYREILERTWKNLVAIQPPRINDVALVHEAVSGLDVGVETLLHPTASRTARNRQGAYYTPFGFARASAARVIDRLAVEQLGCADFAVSTGQLSPHERVALAALISKSTLADFSCGAGVFILAFIDFLKTGPLSDEFSSRDFVHRVVGSDLDYISAELAPALAWKSLDDRRPLVELVESFLHGNPLLPESNAAPELRRLCFRQGMLYHPALGIDLTQHIGAADIIVGNPPWEKIRFEEKSFFQTLACHVSKTSKKNEREEEIVALSASFPKLHLYQEQVRAQIESARNLISLNASLSVSSKGELNTYALFSELTHNLMSEKGVSCLLVKSTLLTTMANHDIFQHFVKNKRIVSAADFVNNKKHFPIDSRERFALIILGKNNSDNIQVATNLTDYEQLSERRNYTNIQVHVLRKINPLTGMIPFAHSLADLELIKNIYAANPVFDEVYSDVKFGRLVHFTNHAKDIVREAECGTLPIYEGKFIERYEGRYATFLDLPYEKVYAPKARARRITDAEKSLGVIPLSRFFISNEKWLSLNRHYKENYSLMWRSLTSPTNSRAVIATILPHVPASQSIQFLQLGCPRRLAVLLGIFNSSVFDHVARQKLTGIDLTQTIVRQLPVPPPDKLSMVTEHDGRIDSIEGHIVQCVASLLSDDPRLASFCQRIAPGSRATHDRAAVLSGIDRLVATAYAVNGTALQYISSERHR